MEEKEKQKNGWRVVVCVLKKGKKKTASIFFSGYVKIGAKRRSQIWAEHQGKGEGLNGKWEIMINRKINKENEG